MGTGRRALLLLLMVIGLTAASLVTIALRPAVLGLDLQGGIEVILKGQDTPDAQVTPESVDRAVEVIRRRVDKFGVSEPEIQTQGKDEIVVSLPGADDPQVVEDLIKPAQLRFYDYTDNLEDGPNTSLFATVTRATKIDPQEPKGKKPTFYAFRTGAPHAQVGQETVTEQALLNQFPGNVLPDGVEQLTVPAGLVVVSQPGEELATRPGEFGPAQYLLLQDRPGLVGKDITSARVDRSNQQQLGVDRGPAVVMSFTGEGNKKFQKVTSDLAVRGQSLKENQTFAVVLDGEIVSRPSVGYEEFFPSGIDPAVSGGAQISGNFTSTSAQLLADQLNSGAIPISLEVISRREVGATLGKESLRQGLIAGLVGLGLVLAFLIFYYRALGVVAAIALLIYSALLYAVVVLIPITLTLPGIAGMILTIGISADANIVIFERVREESRAGKSAMAAMSAGYKKGLAAIIDANVVTLAVAGVIFLFATAGPRGFAFTLLIGTLISLFTAVVATRAIFGVLIGTRFMRDDRIMGISQGRTRISFDWVGRWRLWMVISTVPVLFGLGWLGMNGLNLGIDFESGTRISTGFERPATEDGIRTVVNDLGLGSAKVQRFSENLKGNSVEGFQIQTRTLTAAEQTRLNEALDTKYGVQLATRQIQTVGATFGKQIVRNAIYAIILSLLIVIAYLTLRFEYKLALPAVLSVVHDVALSVGIYSVTGREVTSGTIAAFLTILGYSLYDVVIVFDRIRENAPLMRNSRYRDVVNRSVDETIIRSLITSLATLLPVLALFLFGGETLKDFSFALLVGVLAGGISSVIISAPIAALWKEHEPEQKKRTAKLEKRASRVSSDSDVVDLDVLERAERALDAAPPETTVGLLESGEEPPPETDTPDVDPPTTPSPEDPPDVAPGGGVREPAPPREPRTPSGRPRRHQQVPRRRKT